MAILSPQLHHRITPNYSVWQVLAGISACGAALLVAAPTAAAQEVQVPEYRVKAAFLFNFTKLVDWPTNAFATPHTPLTIGVLGKDPFGKTLDDVVADRKVNGRSIQIMRFNSVDDAKTCQILFICESERRKVNSVIEALRDRPILTVADIKGFHSQGMIELVTTNDTINLRINLEAASRAKLQLSSRLTRLDKNLQPPSVHNTNSPPANSKPLR